jgi:hypothetical protein
LSLPILLQSREADGCSDGYHAMLAKVDTTLQQEKGFASHLTESIKRTVRLE